MSIDETAPQSISTPVIFSLIALVLLIAFVGWLLLS